MKILHTPARFYPYIGGTENLVYNLCKELVNIGHEVKVICADEPPVGSGKIDGIEVRRLRYFGKIANTNITYGLLPSLLKENFDIIHTHLPHPWSADISAAVSILKNKPLFLTYHNDIAGQGLYRPIAGVYNISALQFLLNRAKKIFITHRNYAQTCRFLRPFSNKIVVTPPGVDTDRFKPQGVVKDENSRIVFFLSRLDRFHAYKGLEYLLLAVKKLKEKFPLRLYVGGDGELLGYYRLFARNHGLEESVTFLGFLDEKQKVRYYNLCDVFVLPSISSAQEGFGLVALEAMACAKPVVVTDIVGVAQDVVAQKAGIVVRPGSINELSEALARLFSDYAEMRRKGENALCLVKEKYTWRSHAEIITKVYSLKRKDYGD